MHNFKMCARCNAVVVSNLNSPTADYYRHLSVKYCDDCREIVKREKNAEAVKRYRQRKKAEKTAKQTNLELLQAENEMLRTDYEQLCDAVSILKRELEQIKHEASRI